jgi:hypothetical protein
MDMIATAQLAQLLVASSVGYAYYITFFRPKAVDKPRMQQAHAAKEIVRQRSERWAA